jgi:hypothetical protein
MASRSRGGNSTSSWAISFRQNAPFNWSEA